MVIEMLLFALGIILLIKGADFLIDGASSLAHRLGVSSLIIGLTIVSFGTTMPELTVNILSALRGSTEIAFGNIVGSNITNILLILGVVAIITPLHVKKSTFSKEIPFAILAAVVLLIFSNSFFIDNLNVHILTRVSGIIMLLFFGIFLYYIFESAKKDRKTLGKKAQAKFQNNWKIVFYLLVGIIAIYLGGRWTVNGAVFIARQFRLSEFLISSTIIALGTSLPELVTGITAARKKELDLAIGNVVGANIFNVFWILGMTTLIVPVIIPEFINAVILFLIGISVLLMVFLFTGKKNVLSRTEGIIFVILYVLYLIYVIHRG